MSAKVLVPWVGGQVAKATTGFIDMFTGGKKPQTYSYVLEYAIEPLEALFQPPAGSADQAKLRKRMWAAELARFSPEVLTKMVQHFARTRSTAEDRGNAFLPTLAEVLENCARIDHDQPERKLQRAMRALYPIYGDTRKSWPAEFGPAPGQPGCQLSNELQNQVWRDGLQAMIREVNIKDPLDAAIAIPARARNWWGIDVFTADCIIPRTILAERHVTFTRAEWQARVDALDSKHRAQREAETEAKFANFPKQKPLAKIKETPLIKSLGERAGQLADDICSEEQRNLERTTGTSGRR